MYVAIESCIEARYGMRRSLEFGEAHGFPACAAWCVGHSSSLEGVDLRVVVFNVTLVTTTPLSLWGVPLYFIRKGF